MAPREKEKNEALAYLLMEETLCFQNESPKVITPWLGEKGECGALAHSTNQLKILGHAA